MMHEVLWKHIFVIIKMLSFEGKSGTVEFDKNGDRIADYWIWHLNVNDDEYTQWGEVKLTRGTDDTDVNIIPINTSNVLWYDSNLV